MKTRAIWKGDLVLDAISVPVSLHAAASTSERISFHMLNRETGNRLKRIFVDSETEDPVKDEDEVKGFERHPGDVVLIDPEKTEDLTPENDHRLAIEGFIALDEIDDLHFDRPYFLVPSGEDNEPYRLFRDGLLSCGVAAIAEAVLFRRERNLLVMAAEKGLIGITLNFKHEIRSSAKAFDGIPEMEIKPEMLELASHIIDTKSGSWDPETFDDRYEAALAEVVEAKRNGKPLPKAPEPPSAKVIDLMQALRESAGATSKGGKTKAGGKAHAAPHHAKRGKSAKAAKTAKAG